MFIATIYAFTIVAYAALVTVVANSLGFVGVLALFAVMQAIGLMHKLAA